MWAGAKQSGVGVGAAGAWAGWTASKQDMLPDAPQLHTLAWQFFTGRQST